MKVALLSFHNALNYGAALQAYALQKFLKTNGMEAIYIDYENRHRANSYDMGFLFRKALKERNWKNAVKFAVGAPVMEKRRRQFEKFYTSYIEKTEKCYTNSTDAAELNDKFDKFIVGSDQVWNPANNGQDMAYLLDFVEDNHKKIAYSSSFGVSGLDDNNSKLYANYLSKFYRLSSREMAGVALVESLTGRKDIHLVMDPVFLIDRCAWDALAAPKDKTKYVFFYTNRDSQIDDFVAIGSDYNHLKYHILSTHLKPKDIISTARKIKSAMAPEEFLAQVRDAQLVVTASFHCLAMAIIFRKPFVAILTGDKGKDERVENLLRITGLTNRIMTSSMTPEDIAEKIDYDVVDEKLRSFICNSEEYLLNAIRDGDDVDFLTNKMLRSMDENRVCTDTRCTGCSACYHACPKAAIRMVPDDEGFVRPVIDEEACVHCGICHKVCQVFVQGDTPLKQQRYWGLKAENTVRKNSSSGGAFTMLSDRILKDGGIVVAAQMDEVFVVRHSVARTVAERDKMRHTFYVQSDLGMVFDQVKKILQENKKVLFVGTPCQVAGLKLFVGESDALITADLLCHGAPSPKVFQAFIDFLKSKGDLTEFHFRDKSHGWRGYHVSAKINNKKFTNRLWLKSFNSLFSHNLINRACCSMCPYANYNRPGDITLGDFWGLERQDAAYVDKLGVSLLITNTAKGQALVDSLENVQLREYAKEQTTQNSLCHPAKASGYRNAAFRCLKQQGYAALAKKYGEWNAKGAVKMLARKILSSVK